MRRAPLCLIVLSLLAWAAPAPAPASASDSRIVGGDETASDWPFMVYLDQGRQELELGDFQYCGATLVAPTWVLTAAHCINDETLDPLLTTVVVGRHAKSDDASGERIQAKRILVNPDYSDRGDDAALVELERAPENAQPVKIAGPGEESLWTAGTTATILGWGNTSEGGSTSDVLKEAKVPLVGDDECGTAYSDPSWGWNPAIMVCAGYREGGTDTCQGDSGGPLLVAAPDGWRQVGITSFGEGCARAGWPGVYAEAAGSPIRDWIASVVPEAIAPAAPPAPPATTSDAGTAPAPAGAAPATKAPAPRRPVAKKCKRPKRTASRRAKAKYRRCVVKRRRALRRAG